MGTTIEITASDLAFALWNTRALGSLMPDRGVKLDFESGRWFYTGTTIPVRAVRGDEVLVVDLDSGRIEDNQGGWIADRFGRLGARQRRALAATLGMAA
jgi:hypothetical protein